MTNLIIKNKNFNEKGVIFYLAVIILAIMMAIGLAISAMLLGEIKIIRGMGDSVIAFYAADTGMEKALMTRVGIGKTFLDPLNPEAAYEVIIPLDCEGGKQCIRSVGSYKGVRRAIEVSF